MRTGKICKNPTVSGRFFPIASPWLPGLELWRRPLWPWRPWRRRSWRPWSHSSERQDGPTEWRARAGVAGGARHGAWLGSWGWLKPYLVGGLEHFFPIYIGNNYNNPNWRTHIFQRGRYTTNQLWFSVWKHIQRQLFWPRWQACSWLALDLGWDQIFGCLPGTTSYLNIFDSPLWVSGEFSTFSLLPTPILQLLWWCV